MQKAFDDLFEASHTAVSDDTEMLTFPFGAAPSSQDLVSSLIVENDGTAVAQASAAAAGLRSSSGGTGSDEGAAAASGGPSLPCWPAANSGGGLNGSIGGGGAGSGSSRGHAGTMVNGGTGGCSGSGGGGGGPWAAPPRGPAVGVSRRRGREWFQGASEGRRQTGVSAGEKRACGPEMAVDGESKPAAREENGDNGGGGGGVRRACSSCEGVPLVTPQDAAEGSPFATTGDAPVSAAAVGADGAAAGDKDVPTLHVSTTGDKEDDHHRATAGAVVTPPRPKSAEAPTAVSPTRSCPPTAPPATGESSENVVAKKPAEAGEVAFGDGGASASPRAAVEPFAVAVAVAERLNGHAAAAGVDGDTEFSGGGGGGGGNGGGSDRTPRGTGKDAGGFGVSPAASEKKERLANGSHGTARGREVVSTIAAEPKAVASEEPPLNGDGSSYGGDGSVPMAAAAAAKKPAVVQPMPKPAAASGASPARGVVPVPDASPPIGVVGAPGTLPAVGIVVKPPGPMPAVGVVDSPGPTPAVGVVRPTGPLPAVGVVKPPSAMPAVGVVDAPGPGHPAHRGLLQPVWQQPLPRYPAPAPAPAGAYRMGGGAFGGRRSGPVVDEVSLRLAAVSEALAMLEDVAILPRLYSVGDSVRVEVGRRDEAHAQNARANRTERVSACLSGKTCVLVFWSSFVLCLVRVSVGFVSAGYLCVRAHDCVQSIDRFRAAVRPAAVALPAMCSSLAVPWGLLPCSVLIGA